MSTRQFEIKGASQYLIYFLSLVGNVFVNSDARAKGQVELELDEAIAKAIEFSVDLKAASQQVEIEDANISTVESSRLPSAGIVGGYTYNNSEFPVRNWYGYFTASYNLFRGYQDEANIKLAKIEKNKAELNASLAKNNLKERVSDLFYTWQILDKKEDQAKEALKENQNILNMVTRSKQLGQVSKTDVTEFELRNLAIEEKLLATKQEKNLVMETYLRIAGESKQFIFRKVSLDMWPVKPKSEILKLAKVNSTSIQKANLSRSEFQKRNETSRSRWLPTVDLELDTGFLPEEDEPDSEEGDAFLLATEIRLKASWNLFEGGLINSQKSKTEAQLRKTMFEAKAANNRTSAEFSAIYRNLSNLKDKSQLKTLKHARIVMFFKEVQNEYKRGYRNSGDLASAADLLEQSNAEQLELIQKYILEVLRLEQKLGRSVLVAQKGEF